MESKKSFRFKKLDGSVVTYTTRNPNAMESEQADVEYSKVFVQSIKDTLPTVKAMEKILSDSGVWTKENNDEISRAEEKISALREKLAEIKKEDTVAIEKVIHAIEKIAESVEPLRRIRDSYFSHTAESKAYDAQRDFIIRNVTEDAVTGEKIWPTKDAFFNEHDGEAIYRATYEYIMFSSGTPSTIPDYVEPVKKVEPVPEVVAPEAK